MLPTSNSKQANLALILAVGNCVLAAPMSFPGSITTTSGTDTMSPSSSFVSGTSIIAPPTPAPTAQRRSQLHIEGCDGGIDCPYDKQQGTEEVKQGIVDYDFIVCTDPDSPLCFNNLKSESILPSSASTQQVVPFSFASTATFPGHIASSVPDFHTWASSMASKVSLEAAAASSSAASVASAEIATESAYPGTDGGVQAKSKSATNDRDGDGQTDQDEATAQDEMTSKIDEGGDLMGDMEPYYDAAFVVSEFDFVHVPSDGLSSTTIDAAVASTSLATDMTSASSSSAATPMRPATTSPLSLDDQAMFVARMRRGVKTPPEHEISAEFAQLLDGKFGDGWLDAFAVSSEPPAS